METNSFGIFEKRKKLALGIAFGVVIETAIGTTLMQKDKGDKS